VVQRWSVDRVDRHTVERLRGTGSSCLRVDDVQIPARAAGRSAAPSGIDRSVRAANASPAVRLYQRVEERMRFAPLKRRGREQPFLQRIGNEADFDQNGGHARFARHRQIAHAKGRLAEPERRQVRSHRACERERIRAQPKHARAARAAVERRIGVDRYERRCAQTIGECGTRAIIQAQHRAGSIRHGIRTRQDDARARPPQQRRQILGDRKRDGPFLYAVRSDGTHVERPAVRIARAMARIDNEYVARQLGTSGGPRGRNTGQAQREPKGDRTQHAVRLRARNREVLVRTLRLE
jgi:hypothetical protein